MSQYRRGTTKSSFRCFAILPAAGRSRRMGRPKLLLPWDGETVIARVLSAWKKSRADGVIVVVHPKDNELAKAVSTCGGTVVRPDIPPPEMKASVRAGLEFVRTNLAPTEHDAWLLAPADMPLLQSADIDQVISAHDPANPRIVLPTHAGRRGHPVLFPWSVAAEVQRLPDGEGVNELTRRHTTRELACDHASILADIDTPEDYREQQARANRST